MLTIQTFLLGTPFVTGGLILICCSRNLLEKQVKKKRKRLLLKINSTKLHESKQDITPSLFYLSTFKLRRTPHYLSAKEK